MQTLALLSLRRCCWLLLCQALAVFCAEETFIIELDRPKPWVGQEFQLTALVHKDQIESLHPLGGRPREKRSASETDFQAVCKVLAIGEQSPSLQIKIERFLDRDGTNSEVLLPAGTVLTGGVIAGETYYTIQGSRIPLPQRLKRLLVEFTQLGPSKPQACTEKEAFGTGEPKKVGDTWSLNSTCLTNLLPAIFQAEGGKGFNGTMTLLGVEGAAGSRCLRLGMSLHLQSDKPIGPIPKSANDRPFKANWETTMKFECGGLVPLDEKIPPTKWEYSIEGICNANLTSGESTARFEFRFTESRKAEIKPLN